MFKFPSVLFALIFGLQAICQGNANSDSISVDVEKKWEISLDIVTMYIWRGQSYGGRYSAVQPAFEYGISERWRVATWATTNFLRDSYEKDGVSPRGYQEFDFGITYSPTDFILISLWDYYWPNVDQEGKTYGYFDYGPNGAKSVDASILVDLDKFGIPIYATVSTLVAGNDFRYDNGKPVRNYTTYVEVGCEITNLFENLSAATFRNIEISSAAGTVLNNQAAYYEYADYDRISLINISLSARKEFGLGYGIMMPVSLKYTHNAARSNIDTTGRNFLTAGVSFCM